MLVVDKMCVKEVELIGEDGCRVSMIYDSSWDAKYLENITFRFMALKFKLFLQMNIN